MHCHTHAASRPNQAPTTTHAPACEQHTGHQQKKGTSDARGKYQTPYVQVQPSLDSVNTTKGSVSGPHSPHKRIQKPGKRSIRQLMHCHTHAASRLNQAPTTTHAPARRQQTGHQQTKRTSEARGKYQTPDVQVQPFLDSVNTIAELEPQFKRNTIKGSVR